MAFFKKLTKKVVNDVKETVKEETQKTTEEIKNDILDTVKEYLPQICLFAGGILLCAFLRRPVPVTVKVVVRQV